MPAHSPLATALAVPVLLGALVLTSGLALGQAGPGEGTGRGRLAACRTDLATFCRHVDAGGGRKIQCLAQNRDKLSPECAAVVDARKGGGAKGDPTAAPMPGPAGGSAPPAGLAPGAGKRVAGPPLRVRKACAVDLATHCQTIEKGGGRRVACLQKMMPQLTPACSAAITEVIERRKAMRAACAGDRKSLCAGQKGAEAMACLRQNVARVSPRCAELLPAAGPRRKQAEPAAPPK